MLLWGSIIPLVLHSTKLMILLVEEINNITGTRIIDMTNLSPVLSCLACPECLATDTLVL